MTTKSYEPSRMGDARAKAYKQFPNDTPEDAMHKYGQVLARRMAGDLFNKGSIDDFYGFQVFDGAYRNLFGEDVWDREFTFHPELVLFTEGFKISWEDYGRSLGLLPFRPTPSTLKRTIPANNKGFAA